MHPLVGTTLSYLPLFMPLVGWPLTSALINLAFYKKTPAEWETWALRKPILAFVVELCRANGWDIAKNLRVLQRFAARRSGRVPEEGWDRLPISPSLRRALQDPAARQVLENLLVSQTPDSAVRPPPPSVEGS